jgi:hypothetical protein
MPQIILQDPILARAGSQFHASRGHRCFIHQRNGYVMVMRPLLFVNWRQVSSRFTALMWLVACVLAIVVLLHLPGGGAPAPASAHVGTPLGQTDTSLARLRH